MSRLTLEHCDMFSPVIRNGFRFLPATIIPADNYVLDPLAPTFLILNPAGAVDILMPTSSASIAGLTFLMLNISASTITLKTDGDAAFTTAISLATLECAMVFCTGSATQAIGWRGLATALSS